MYTGDIEKCTDGTSIQLYAGEGKHVYTFTNELTGCTDEITIRVNCLTADGPKVPTTNGNISISDNTAEKDNLKPVADNDSRTVSMNEAALINVVANDRAAKENATVTILDAPQNGTLSVKADNSVEYQPNQDYCDSETPDFFRYKICTDKGCDEAEVKVIVECAPIKVYSGFSPNRDDINDYFKIEGLDAYPDNELKIFNRFGKLLHQQQGYDNTWGGEVDGEILPNGTYFYILSDGKGKQYSGFVHIKR